MLRRTARITSKGQVTIPSEVRRLLGVRPRDNVDFLVEKDQVRLVPAKSIVAHTAGMLKHTLPRLSEQEEEIVAEEAMAHEVEEDVGKGQQ
jgi:antitoxin PrlF